MSNDPVTGMTRILFVEDVPVDAELAERALRKEGLRFASARVETREDFTAALETFHPDVIISDYALPEFDGMQALKLSLERDPLLPFILFTGSMNEETAVACMKAGATDYVLKGRISRLPFAVREALQQQQERLDKENAKQALRARTDELEALYTLSSHLSIAQTETAMLPVLLAEVKRVLGADAGAIILLDENRGEFSVALADGDLQPNIGRVFSAGEGVSGRAFEQRRAFLVDDYSHDGDRWSGSIGAENMGPAVFAPLQSRDQFLGVLAVVRHKGAACYDSRAVRLLAAAGEMAGNALYRVRLYDQAVARLQHLQSLQAIDSAIAGSLDLNFTLRMLVDEVASLADVDAVAVRLLSPHTLLLEYAAGRGFRTDGIPTSRPRLGEGYAGQVALSQRTLVIQDVDAQVAGADPELTHLRPESFVAYYGVPLLAKGNVQGVLEIYQRAAPRAALPANLEWLDFVEALAHRVAIAIDNIRLFEKLQRSNYDLGVAYDAIIKSWARATEQRDGEAAGHTLRVTEMAEQLARALGWNEMDIIHVRRGALLHDVGKIGVPDAILSKPDSLSEDEWAVVRQHPQYAYDMLWPVTFLRPAMDIPYCHHEKWDGTGYPRGLAGEQIPLAARLFAVADAWDMLTSDRPYRLAWLPERAREYIHEQAGRHFDPLAVETFEAFMREQNTGSTI